MSTYPRIRHATPDDVPRILEIAHQYRDALGYVHPMALREHISARSVLVTEWFGNIWGFVEYHARRDGWQTVYHLAVDKHATGQGMGRYLLYAVPCPIRLKVTADNVCANAFYHHTGMRVARTEAGKKRQLLVYERRVLYELVKGGARSIPDIAQQAGMAYGVRGDYTAYAWPFAVDIDFEAYRLGAMTWADYLQQVSRNHPVQAMVVDYGPHQPSRRVLYQQIRDLRALGVLRILVCPKFERAIAHTPRWCITALSVPSAYAGWLPDDFKMLKGRRVHLLGGEVRLQQELAARVAACGGRVISMDGSLHTKAGAFGRVFDGTRWQQTAGQETATLILESSRRIAEYVQGKPIQLPLAI